MVKVLRLSRNELRGASPGRSRVARLAGQGLSMVDLTGPVAVSIGQMKISHYTSSKSST